MIIPVGGERTHSQRHGAIGAITDDHSLLARDQINLFLQSRAVKIEDPGGARLRMKLGQIRVRRRHAWILAAAELYVSPVDRDFFLDTRQQNVALDRRFQRRDQECVIAAGVDAERGSHGEGACAVGL